MNTSRFLTIPAEEYHAASRCGRYMSSHNLADFRESPELYRRKTGGEIAEAVKASRWRLDAPHTASSWRGGVPPSTSSSSSPTVDFYRANVKGGFQLADGFPGTTHLILMEAPQAVAERVKTFLANASSNV